jgi:C4-dicarboxylate-specific signal transduction histidine kinase
LLTLLAKILVNILSNAMQRCAAAAAAACNIWVTANGQIKL